jgi:hypothetical protein
MSTRKVLGRGLEALIPVSPAMSPEPQPGESVTTISLDTVDSNPFQPRQRFDD